MVNLFFFDDYYNNKQQKIMKQVLIALLAMVSMTQAVQIDQKLFNKFITPEGKWMPDQYSSGDDDQLMKNLIEKGLAFTKDKGFDDKYPFKTIKGCGCSQDACTCCMTRHTHFWIDKQGAFGAAKELVGVNLHL